MNQSDIETLGYFIYKLPAELVCIILQFLNYEEMIYISHYAPTLTDYMSLIRIDTYAPSEPISSYININPAIYKMIMSNLMVMPYTEYYEKLFSHENNIITPVKLYNMTIEIVSQNDADLAKFFLDNVLQHSLNMEGYDSDYKIIDQVYDGDNYLFDDIAGILSYNDSYMIFDIFMRWFSNYNINDGFEFFESTFYHVAMNNYDFEFINYMMDNYIANGILNLNNSREYTISSLPLDLKMKCGNTYTDEETLDMLTAIFEQFKKNNIIHLLDTKYALLDCIVDRNTDEIYSLDVFKLIFINSSNEVKENKDIILQIVKHNRYSMFVNVIKYLHNCNSEYFQNSMYYYLYIISKWIPDILNIEYIKYILIYTTHSPKVYNQCLILNIIYTNYETIVWLCKNGAKKHESILQNAKRFILQRLIQNNVAYDDVLLEKCIDYVETNL